MVSYFRGAKGRVLSKSIIKHIKELPTWFKLEKYEAAKTLDAAGWHKNLFVRNELLRIGSESFQKALKANFELPRLFMDDLAYLRKNPIFTEGSLFILNSFNVRVREESAVRTMTISDLYYEVKHIDIDKQIYAQKIILHTDDSEEFWAALYSTEAKKEWSVNPLLEELSKFHIHVNLNLPEKLLIEQFAAYIKKIQYDKSKRKPDFEGWVKFAILPYLDLKIWEQESKKSIPNSVMANAIFPPHEGGEEVVRKTTKKTTDKILTQKHLMFLEDYAANEIAERNTGLIFP